jgi:hypothetical protein
MQLALSQKPETKVDLEVQISQVVDLIHKGIESWQEAGLVLMELRQRKPGIFADIIKREPMLTVDMLTTIERIGRREIYPRLLLDSSIAAKKIRRYPYAEQERLCREPIDVVVSRDNGHVVVSKKMATELSLHEVERALGKDGPIPVEKQALQFHLGQRGNAEWQALAKVAIKAARTDKGSIENLAAKIGTPAPLPADTFTHIGNWVIRKTIGKNLGFERTQAHPPGMLRVILTDDVAVIEVYERKK